MNKSMFISLLIGLFSFAFIGSVSATATREEMLQIFSETALDAMSEEEYNKYASLDYDYLVQDEVIVPYSEYPEEISPFAHTDLLTTNYKKLKLSVLPYSSTSLEYVATLTLVWLQIPVTRSYDVIALRFYDVAPVNGTQDGTQLYELSSGGTDSVYYSYNGRNMKICDQGYGISMNLVNNNIVYMENYTSIDVMMNGSDPAVYGSFQHAISNVSLADSQNYNISYFGLGDVINFDPDVADNYDHMAGVAVEL